MILWWPPKMNYSSVRARQFLTNYFLLHRKKVRTRTLSCSIESVGNRKLTDTKWGSPSLPWDYPNRYLARWVQPTPSVVDREFHVRFSFQFSIFLDAMQERITQFMKYFYWMNEETISLSSWKQASSCGVACKNISRELKKISFYSFERTFRTKFKDIENVSLEHLRVLRV